MEVEREREKEMKGALCPRLRSEMRKKKKRQGDKMKTKY